MADKPNSEILWQPLGRAGTFKSTAKQIFWHRGGGIGAMKDATFFVDQLRFPAYRILQGSAELNLLVPNPKNINCELIAIEKSLAKMWAHLHMREDPTTVSHRKHAVQTSPIDLSSPMWKPNVSRNNDLSTVHPDTVESMQWECDFPLRYHKELAEATWSSDFYRVEEKEKLAPSHTRFRMEEFNRVGDDAIYLAIRTLDQRMRRYMDQRGVGGVQNDKAMQRLLWAAEPEPMEAADFWSMIQELDGRLNERSYTELLDGKLSAMIDLHGQELVSLALACQEFHTTGKSSYLFQYDQSTSGIGLEALFMQRKKLMQITNLLGGPRGDGYREIMSFLARELDFHFRRFEGEGFASVRQVGKNLARGGTYGAGASTMAWHMLGIDPDDEVSIEAKKLNELQDMIDIPEVFWTHPHFAQVLRTDGSLHPNADFESLRYTMMQWCRKAGYPALHGAMPHVRPFIRRVREANKVSLSRKGEMLSWTFPNGQRIFNNPFVRSMKNARKIRVSYKGMKDIRAYVQEVEYDYYRDTSANFVHSVDAYLMSQTQLGAKRCETPFHIVGNHDSFRVKGRYAKLLKQIWRNSYIHMGASFDFAALCNQWGVEPVQGIGQSALIDETPADMCAIFL